MQKQINVVRTRSWCVYQKVQREKKQKFKMMSHRAVAYTVYDTRMHKNTIIYLFTSSTLHRHWLTHDRISSRTKIPKTDTLMRATWKKKRNAAVKAHRILGDCACSPQFGSFWQKYRSQWCIRTGSTVKLDRISGICMIICSVDSIAPWQFDRAHAVCVFICLCGM